MNAMIEAKRQDTAAGAILFDAAALAQAGVADGRAFDAAWFDATRWRALDVRGGRGSVRVADAPFGASVLRHYRRGGMVASLLGDSYLWAGEERTRGFAEFRLLVRLRALGLDVPAPVATRYLRRGPTYRADLVTRRIENAATLAELLIDNHADNALAERIGEAIATFHAAGVYHADLNAHNILVDDQKVWLIDFDRGELRTPAPTWRRANRSRLLRSCRKILGAPRDDAFESAIWTALVQSYEREFARRTDASLRSVRT
jgi:3-deoxy-D-manno-octulosonic acid kinase